MDLWIEPMAKDLYSVRAFCQQQSDHEQWAAKVIESGALRQKKSRPQTKKDLPLALGNVDKDSELKRMCEAQHLCFLLSPRTVRNLLEVLTLPPNMVKKQNSKDLRIQK